MPWSRPVLRHARPAGRAAWRGLRTVLAGSDPPPLWRSAWQRRVVLGGLVLATLGLCAATLTGIFFGLHYIPVRTPGGQSLRIQHVGSPIPAPAFAPHWFLPAGPITIWVLVALAVIAPLPLAARYPLMGWRIGWLTLLGVPLLGATWWGGWLWDPVQLLVLPAVFWVAGIRHRRTVVWWMWALTLIPWWLWAGRNGPGLPAAILGTIAFTAVAVAADAMGSRRSAQLSLADQTERTELERARRAVLEERTRIARELHDVVAHHMSLIAVRAETAPYRLHGLPGPVRAEFGTLSGAAREALADMRRLLGVLRDDEPAGRAPQPQLSDLAALIETARQAGVAVRLSADPALDDVPSRVGVCAYRIVQESLSNAGRHAPGSEVTVSVSRGADGVRLRVSNGPGGPGPARVNGGKPGHGLTGMRERVLLLGGSLAAGPSPDGGFVVSALLPLGEAA